MIMEDKKVADAAWTLLTSFQEANRIVAEHLVAAQEQNRKLAEQFFKDGMEVLRANQQAVADNVVAQERSVQYTQRFFTEGMEVIKANQTAAQSLVATQERTMQYAEHFFNSGIEVLRSQAESMRALLHDLEQQVAKQREALQTLALAPVEIALDIFAAPLTAYQKALDIAGAVTREEFKWAEHATERTRQADQQSDEHQDN
jgi:predicted Fe-Mo cluster-binding NifX family protein